MSSRSLIIAFVFTGLAACATDEHEDGSGLSEAERNAAFEQSYLDKDLEKADSQGCSGVRVPDRNGFQKRIALTFDDGPNPETTPDVIKILRRHGIPATFFMNGRRVTSDTTRRIIEEIVEDPNFILGNHTWSHVNMARQSPSVVAKQIDSNTDVIEAAGGEGRYFRFPFGSSTCSTAEAVRSRGYMITGWHIDSADWCFSTHGGTCPKSAFKYVPDSMREDMQGFVMKQVRANNGGIVLFHDIHRYTADNLENIIVALEDEGFTFTSLDDVETFPKLNGQVEPIVPQTFIGDPCTDDAECGFEASSGRGYCHPAGFCTLACEGFCPDKTGKVATFCAADTGVEPLNGICVSQSTAANGHCADVPGTIDASVERYVGESSAPLKTAEACIPAP